MLISLTQQQQQQEPCRIIFPILMVSNGNLGGVTSADAICLRAANSTNSKVKEAFLAGNVTFYALLGYTGFTLAINILRFIFSMHFFLFSSTAGTLRNPIAFLQLTSNDCYVNPNKVSIASNTNDLFNQAHPVDINIDIVSISVWFVF